MENGQRGQECQWVKKRRGKRRGKKDTKGWGRNVEQEDQRGREKKAKCRRIQREWTRRGRTRRKEGKEENSIVRVWERDKGWKGGREEATWRYPPEKRWKYWSGMPATTCTERALLLLRHPIPLLPLFPAFTSSRSLLWLSSFSSCLAFTILSSLFSLPASVLFLLLFHFILLILPFFSLPRFVTFTFISINLSLF